VISVGNALGLLCNSDLNFHSNLFFCVEHYNLIMFDFFEKYFLYFIWRIYDLVLNYTADFLYVFLCRRHSGLDNSMLLDQVDKREVSGMLREAGSDMMEGDNELRGGRRRVVRGWRRSSRGRQRA
jgi:hypothetical protein